MGDSGTKYPNISCQVWVQLNQTCICAKPKCSCDKIGVLPFYLIRIILPAGPFLDACWIASVIQRQFSKNTVYCQFFLSHPPAAFPFGSRDICQYNRWHLEGKLFSWKRPFTAKVGQIGAQGLAGRYLYCRVAFWAKLLPDSEEIPLPLPGLVSLPTPRGK